MSRLGLWIAAAVVGGFAAGLNLGLVAPDLLAATDAAAAGEDEEYVHDMVRDYGLSAAQERSLRLVLRRADDERNAAYRSFALAELPPAIVSAIRDVNGRLEQRIRAVLDEGQRSRYDRATRPK